MESRAEVCSNIAGRHRVDIFVNHQHALLLASSPKQDSRSDTKHAMNHPQSTPWINADEVLGRRATVGPVNW